MGLITLCMKKALNTSSVLKQDEKKAFIRTSDKTRIPGESAGLDVSASKLFSCVSKLLTLKIAIW